MVVKRPHMCSINNMSTTVDVFCFLFNSKEVAMLEIL